MTFDWSVNIGQIVTILGMVFALISAYYIIKSDIRSLTMTVADNDEAIDRRMIVQERVSQDQTTMNAKIMSEIGAVRQDVAVIKDRLEPPAMSPQAPSKG